MSFVQAFAATVGVEGAYTNSPDDPGNWTGGAVGAGELKGTNFGISAAAYPSLDIANLTLAQAQAIYQQDYWGACSCDNMPAPIAFFVFDTAVNQGQTAAKKMLQGALGVTVDGIIGPNTLAALAAAAVPDLELSLAAYRIKSYEGDSDYALYWFGWLRRTFSIFLQAQQAA